MAVAAGTLADEEVAQLAEIVAPGIGEIFRRRFIEHQRLVVEFAVIGRALLALAPDDARSIAIAPRHEGLRFHVSRRIGDRKAHIGVNMIVGAAGHFSPAGVLDQLAGAVIGEIGFRFGPAEIEFWHFDFRRRAAGDMQLLEKLFGDRVGLLAGQPFRRGALVVTLDRQHVRYAEAGKDVTNVRLAQYPPHVRKEGGKLLARREDLLMVGTVEVVDERRSRYFGDDRSGVPRLYWNVVGADRERRVVARRSWQ